MSNIQSRNKTVYLAIITVVIISIFGIKSINATTPQLIQSQFANSLGGFSPSISVTFGNNVNSGSLLIVYVDEEGGTQWTNTLTDGQGDQFTQMGNYLRTGNFELSVWTANRVIGGATTITAGNNGAGSNHWQIWVQEYNGIAPINVLDANAITTGVSATPNTIAFTTSTANDLLTATCLLNTGPQTLTVGTGMGNFLIGNDVSTNLAIESNIISAAGTYNAAMGSTGSHSWICAADAFRPLVGGILTTPTLTLSNTLIDQGQGILFTANVIAGNSPYTYNFIVINNNAPTANGPLAFFMSCPIWNGWAGSGCDANGLSGNSLNPNSVIWKDNGYGGLGDIHANVIANVPFLTVDGSLSSIYIGANYLHGNSINPCLWIGGSTTNQAYYSAQWNTIMSNTAVANMLAQNVISIINNDTNLDCIELDPEVSNPGDLAFGYNKIFTSVFASNVQAVYPNVKIVWTVFKTDLQGTNGFATANMVGIANYINYDSSPESGSGVTAALAQLQGNYPITQTFYWFNGANPNSYTNMVANSAAAVTNGFGGLAFYSGQYSEGNFIVYNAFKAANSLYTGGGSANVVVANYLISNSYTSNSFFWLPPANLWTSNTFKANVSIIDSALYTVSTLYSAIGYNSAFSTTPTLNSNIAIPSTQQVGNSILFTASGISGGTSPYSYNFIVTNTVTGASITNQLYINNAFTSNSWRWTIPSVDQANTVKVNVIIYDNATTHVLVNSIYTGTITIPTTIPSLAPTLTLQNSILPNSIDLIMGYPSDNAFALAICPSTDTCQIWKQGGTSYLANGVTTVSLAYNALPGAATTGIYVNDITSGLTTNGLYNSIIRRIDADPISTITFTNNQGNYVVPNAILSFSVNALNFTPWESNSLNNTAVAFSNGTITYSWIEGNSVNSISNANTLINSPSVTYFVQGPPTNAFLPANTGTAKTNTMILVFTTTTNNILDGNMIGEGAWLTCPNGIGAGCGNYGKYDNGGKFLAFYSNFTNTNQWATANTVVSNSLFTVNNGLVIYSTGDSGSGVWFSSLSTHVPLILRMGVSKLQVTGGAPSLFIQESQSNSVFSTGYAFPNGYIYSRTSGTAIGQLDWIASPTPTESLVNSINGQSIPTTDMSLYWSSLGNESVSDGTNTIFAFDANQAISNYYLELGAIGNSHALSANVFYIMGYNATDSNGIMPSYTFSPPSILSSPILTLSNTFIDQGQSILFTASAHPGLTPYTYNYQIVNSITGITIANQLYTLVSTSTNTFLWMPPANLWTSNTFKANVVITDTTPTTVNTLYNSFGYNGVLSVTLSPSSNTFIIGNAQIMTGTISGGTKSYTYNWIVTNTAGFFANGLYTGNAFTQNQFAFTPLAIGTYNVKISVKDSASTQTSNTVSNSIITVINTALIPSLNPTTAVLPIGQGQVFTGTWYYGTTPYSATLKSATTSNCLSTTSTVQLITGIVLQNTTFAPVSPTTSTYYCLFVTDSMGASENSTASLLTVTNPNINTTGPTIILPKINVTCKMSYNAIAVNEMLICQGSEPNSLVTGWNLTLYNESSTSIPIVTSSAFNTNSFYYQNTNGMQISNVVAYTAIVRYTAIQQSKSAINGSITNSTYSGYKTFQFPIQFKPGFNGTTDGIIVFIILLTFIGFGVLLAQTPGGAVHGISNTMFLTAFAVFLCFMLGFTTGLGALINSGIIILLILFGIYEMSLENKTQYYQG